MRWVCVRPRKYRLMELPEKVKYWSDRVVRAHARRATYAPRVCDGSGERNPTAWSPRGGTECDSLVCAFHGVSPRDRWLRVLPGWQMNVNVNVNVSVTLRESASARRPPLYTCSRAASKPAP